MARLAPGAPASRRQAASLDALYQSTCDHLRQTLEQAFGVETRFAPLPELLGFVVTATKAGRKDALVIAADATPAEQLYVYVHTAAHLLLGHGERPFATLLEHRRVPGDSPLAPWEEQEHREADALASAIFWGALGDRHSELPLRHSERSEESRRGAGGAHALSQTLFGRHHHLLRRGLRIRVTRPWVLFALKLARSAFHRSGARHAMAEDPIVQGLREIYCLTEVVSIAPALAPSREKAS
jgi:hypothetical protein